MKTTDDRELLPQGSYMIPLADGKPCGECGGHHCAVVDVRLSSASFGTEVVHKPECSALRCRHGLRWEDGCEACDSDAEFLADG